MPLLVSAARARRSSLNIFTTNMSITSDRIFSKSLSICSDAMKLNMTRDMCLVECRTFGAHWLRYIFSRPDGRAYFLPDLRT